MRRLLVVSAVLAVAVGVAAAVSGAQSRGAATLSPAALAAECSRPLSTPTTRKRDTFLRISGIDGESRDETHRGEIDVLAYSLGADAGLGRAPTLRPLVILKALDKASPPLFKGTLQGVHFQSMVLSQSESSVDFFRLTMKNVQIASYEHVGGDRATGERVCLSYAEAEVEYRPRNPDGSFGAPVRASL